ncbi:hypothetical protein MGG_11280 [Pyricularia oryzae 70-15]|uniref:Autophagy-related protein 27 n=1 Tax=Pyricularia oryzae (strain 70-15 / ATCC MYA-4617 / FGSC 8958) TaxID=242507 RepID=G4MWW9_PYRO7|nr:uncharacterized protein MGG_11280 [Pyricularia oryzae 70-15]EHA54261.1 hypothetical protein MGG_11280 [Pyricularia oryzae 70-15]
MRPRTSRHHLYNGYRLAYLILLSYSCKVTLASPVSGRPRCVSPTVSQPTPIASGLVILGYHDGDIGRPLQVPYGKVVVTDSDRMMWGYCGEVSVGDETCRLAGASSESHSSICTTATWTRRDGAAFASLGCGPTATTAHILEEPLYRVFIGQETLFPSGETARAGRSESGLDAVTVAVPVEIGYEAAQATETGTPESGVGSHDSVEVPATATTSAAAESPQVGGLAPGQVGGIVVGSIAGAALLAFGTLYIAWRHLLSRFSMAMGSIYMTLYHPRPAPASTSQAHAAGP